MAGSRTCQSGRFETISVNVYKRFGASAEEDLTAVRYCEGGAGRVSQPQAFK
jgi:hypothetical protein